MNATPPVKPRTRQIGGRNAAANMTAVEIFMPIGTCPCSSACLDFRDHSRLGISYALVLSLSTQAKLRST